MLISSLGTQQAGLEILGTLQGEHRLSPVKRLTPLEILSFLSVHNLNFYDGYVYLYHHISWWYKKMFTYICHLVGEVDLMFLLYNFM